MSKEMIVRNFSKWAHMYDHYCQVQRHVGDALTEYLPQKEVRSVLDIGCGTGNFTELLRSAYPEARITALDISDEMIQQAREKLEDESIEYIVADAEYSQPAGRFDLITSNASFQWFNEPDELLRKTHDLLSAAGELVVSVFGPMTFYELRDSIHELFGEDRTINANRFVSKDYLVEALSDHYDHVLIDEEIIQKEYPSLMALLQSIKYTGTQGDGLGLSVLWTPKKIIQLEKIYRAKIKGHIHPDNEGKFYSTYQIFYCHATKKNR